MNSLWKVLVLTLSIVICVACGQDYNSNSSDGLTGGNPVGDAAFADAYAVIKAQCINCHSNYHATWNTFTTEAAWKKAGYVKAGNSSGSTLMTILINNGGTMPKDGAALSNADLDKLTSWIDGMQ